MNVIHIYLGYAADTGAEAVEMGNFIRSLNDRYVKSGLYFRLHAPGELPGNNRPEDPAALKQCEYFYMLFHKKAETALMEAFDAALERFRAEGAPKLFTFYKEVDGDVPADVQGFLARLDREIQHYYTTFRTLDTVKLKMLMELSQRPELHSKLEMRDGKLWCNGEEVTDVRLENLPFYEKNEAIGALREEIGALEEDFMEVLAELGSDPDNEKLKNRRRKLETRLGDARERLHKQELALMQSAMQLHGRLSDGRPVTARALRAAALFEAGKANEALAVLDEDAFQADLRRVSEKADLLKQEAAALVQELLTKIDILKSRFITEAVAADILRLYAQAWDISLRHGLVPEWGADYVTFLRSRQQHHRGIQVGEALYHLHINRDGGQGAPWARVCLALGALYIDAGRYAEAEVRCRETVLALRPRASEELLESGPLLAEGCELLGAVYYHMDRRAQAIDCWKDRLDVLQTLAAHSPAVYEPRVACALYDLYAAYRSRLFSPDRARYRNEARALAARYKDTDPVCRQICDLL